MLAVDDIPCAMMVTDTQGCVQRMNAEFLRIVGGDESRWRGASMDELLTPAARIFVQTYVFPMLHDARRVKELYLRLVGADGKPVPVMLNAACKRADQTADACIVWAVFVALERSRFEAELIQARADAEGLAERLVATSRQVESLNRELFAHAQQVESRNRELSELSLTDPLTGLHNRRALERAVHAWQPAAGQPCTASLLLIDVDHFKRINDSFGHPEGDRVLVSLARELRASARTTDLVVRLGGEEFVLWLPGADAVAAQDVAERVHRGVADLRTPGGALTVSVGLATCDNALGAPCSDMLGRLLERADRAVYQAKAEGRARTVAAVEA